LFEAIVVGKVFSSVDREKSGYASEALTEEYALGKAQGGGREGAASFECERSCDPLVVDRKVSSIGTGV
jgi:hypothetical protein